MLRKMVVAAIMMAVALSASSAQAGGKIIELNILTDPARLRELDLAVVAP